MSKIVSEIAISNEYTSKTLGQDVSIRPPFRLKRKHWSGHHHTDVYIMYKLYI